MKRVSVTRPRGPDGAMFVLGHGAGGSMEDPLLVDLSNALTALGHGVARFDFRYREEGRKLPDRAPILEENWRDVLASLRRTRTRNRRWIIGGKSMGGRMASHLCANAESPPADGLLLLGYPLHPPKRPDKLRAEHLPRISIPTLFIQGTKDPLCDLVLMKKSVRPMRRAELVVVEGGDHSLAVPRKIAPRNEHIPRIAETIHRWLADVI